MNGDQDTEGWMENVERFAEQYVVSVCSKIGDTSDLGWKIQSQVIRQLAELRAATGMPPKPTGSTSTTR